MSKEKSLNLQLQEFEDGLLEYINSGPLPVKAKLLCLKSIMPGIMSALARANAQAIAKERADLKKSNGLECNRTYRLTPYTVLYRAAKTGCSFYTKKGVWICLNQRKDLRN